MKKAKFAKKVAKLVETGYESGTDGQHMAYALVEAGLKMLCLEGEIDTGKHLYLTNAVNGDFEIGERPVPVDTREMREMLIQASQQFSFYAGNHEAKDTPEGDEKARVNRNFATLCLNAAGVSREEAAESAVRPPESPVRADLPFMAPIDAHGASVALLREIHDAPDDDPAKSLAFEGEDRFIAIMLTGLGYLQVDDISDIVTLTTEGRLLAGYRPEGHMELPVEVAEITGNIDERELAARYIDSKITGVDQYIATGDPQHRETFEHVAVVLREIAGEFRQGLHWPTVHIAGRVIAYNEDRGTGHSHAGALYLFFGDVYARNLKAGWWTDISTGQPKKRNVGELFILMVTELAEAYNAYVAREADDKLPEYPGVGVEMGDLLIRIADFCGALQAGNIIEHDPTCLNPGQTMFEEVVGIAARYEAIRKTPEARGEPETAELMPAMDVAIMVDAKLAFNATRADHKIENRLKEGGKVT